MRDAGSWEDVFGSLDACVTPVLTMEEAPRHAHLVARRAFVEVDGVVQVAPPVRFSQTAATVGTAPPRPGADGGRILSELGYSAGEVDALRAGGCVG